MIRQSGSFDPRRVALDPSPASSSAFAAVRGASEVSSYTITRSGGRLTSWTGIARTPSSTTAERPQAPLERTLDRVFTATSGAGGKAAGKLRPSPGLTGLALFIRPGICERRANQTRAAGIALLVCSMYKRQSSPRITRYPQSDGTFRRGFLRRAALPSRHAICRGQKNRRRSDRSCASEDGGWDDNLRILTSRSPIDS